MIHNTGSHVVGKDCLEDTLRCFQIKEDNMNAKIIMWCNVHGKMCNSGCCTCQDKRYREYGFWTIEEGSSTVEPQTR